MTRIKRIYTDQISADPLNPRHPCAILLLILILTQQLKKVAALPSNPNRSSSPH